jgi:hypothetical protein
MLNFDGQLVDVWIFGGESGQGDTEFERGLKIRRTLPLVSGNAKSNMATDHGVSINVCTSAKKAGANPAIGLLSPPNLSRSVRNRHASRAATLMPWP